ncbi:MAG: hypothetical protein P9X22_08970, partial [Candidatus Zapsychrus exili]|nr:hypothetical protein [Candidatus Zapsychrus exili]
SYAEADVLTHTIESDKEIYSVGEEVSLALTWQSFLDKDVFIYFREDMLLQGMLTFKDSEGKKLLSKTVLVDFAPQYKPTIPAGGIYVHQLRGSFLKSFDDLILRFNTKTLSQMPVVLKSPGKFYIICHYQMPINSSLADNAPEVWTGVLTSNEIQIEVVEKE